MPDSALERVFLVRAAGARTPSQRLLLGYLPPQARDGAAG